MKALERLREISNSLAPFGIEDADKEAEIIITQGLRSDLADILRDNPELTDDQTLMLEGMVSRREKREPLQYIIGYCDFLGLKILVGRGILIPRPETELMAEYAIKTVGSQRSAVSFQKKSEIRNPKSEITNSRLQILDLCTGSGCLALALARAFPEALVSGVDISETAINYAVRNADVNRIKNVSFLKGHLFEPVSRSHKFDLIISNPPYIKKDDIKELQPEIKDWEPIDALDGGSDGLDYYREIIPSAGKFLHDNGILMLEMGAGYSGDISRMMEDAGYAEIEIRRDYAGIERIIQAKWTK